MTSKAHWERIYETKAPAEVSWFQPRPDCSLEIMRQAAIAPPAAIIDVGGGASTLVDGLLARGFEDITVLDLSRAALAAARSRLGERAAQVQWIEADILRADLPERRYDVWHDRAVFHFLTGAADRRAYVAKALRTVKPGGLVVVATFADDGPARCSGLPVMRYDASTLHAAFGAPFELLCHQRESHRTPGGDEQRFVYCALRAGAS